MGRRYALLIGANHGASEDAPLVYAIRDAERMADTLTDIGGFAPDDLVVLKEPTADEVRRSINRINARLRSASPRSLLLVFYSGHADATHVRLGNTRLPWEELRNAVVGSSARTRLLIVDACRSGRATRVKGVRRVEPFAIGPHEEEPEGFAVLSSATAGEDAQESDALEGSFFSHHFTTALRGAADEDEDGAVSLVEAYDYAAEQTVASSASTFAGIQHPTYVFALKGRQNLILTQPDRGRSSARLDLGDPGYYLIYRERPRGRRLEAELTVSRRPKRLALPEGRYFIQRREPQRYHEGVVELVAGAATRPKDLKPIEYARLVRKGSSNRSTAVSLVLFSTIESSVLEDYPLLLGARLSAGLHFEHATLTLAGAYGRSPVSDPARARDLEEVKIMVGGRRAFDLGPVALSIGLRPGLAWARQRSRTSLTDTRSQWWPSVDSLLTAEWSVFRGWLITAEAILRVAWPRIESAATFNPDPSTVARVQWGGAIGFGRMW